MLKKLHFCYGRASLLKYHEALKFDFEFVETKFLSVWGRAPCKFYGCQAWGHLLQGTAAGGSTTFSINALGRAMLKNKTWIEMPPSIDGRVCSMCRKTRDQLNIVTFQKYAWPVAATGQFYGLLSRAQQWIGQFYCFPTWSHTPAQMLPKGPNFAQDWPLYGPAQVGQPNSVRSVSCVQGRRLLGALKQCANQGFSLPFCK